MQYKHLGDTLSFRCALWIPLVTGALLWALITYSEGVMSLCFKASCVQTFFMIYKFPIAIAGSSLPLIAMVAALQRSKEAAMQLKEVQLNNRFGNYLKHRESFDSLLNEFCDRSNIAIPRTVHCESHSLYRKLFPESGFNNPLWLGRFDKGVIEDYDKKADHLLAVIKKDAGEFDFLEFMEALHGLKKAMAVSYSSYKMAVYTKSDGSRAQFDVPALIDQRFCLVICLSDTLEIYGLIKNYANHGVSLDLSGFLGKTGIAAKVKSSVAKVEFKVPPSWQNTDVPATS